MDYLQNIQLWQGHSRPRRARNIPLCKSMFLARSEKEEPKYTHTDIYTLNAVCFLSSYRITNHTYFLLLPFSFHGGISKDESLRIFHQY